MTVSGKNMVRFRFTFYGRVQGVGFRWSAARAAETLDITGWVENRSDGSVRMEAQGREDDIRRLIDTLRRRRYIDIERIDQEVIPLVDHEYGFRERGW